jgi:two-component system CheB/CheR fusion protein
MLPLIKNAVGEMVSVSCKSSPDLSAVRVDPGQFEAALLNLALNARDAMPDGGALRIEARKMMVEPGDAKRRMIPPGDYVVMEITDTGFGMWSDTARRAFEPFFTTKAVGKGSGLGLSMVYGFARQSGGTAEIESRVGSGTTIRLYLPCSDEMVSRVLPPSVGHPPMSRKASILVVEDQEEIRQLLANSLDEFGHDVRTARAAEEAIEILGQDPGIEVLVTDITLPGGMTGTDLVRQARQLLPDLKILTISGNASEEFIGASPLDRCVFLPKPFRPSDLNRAVVELL